MKISYVSDLHLDFWIPFDKNQDKWKKKTTEFIDKLIKTDKSYSDVLVVAGDLSHYNLQSYWALSQFSSCYDKVYFTLGNHDLYIISNNQAKNYKHSSENRVKDLLERVSFLPNVIHLNKFEKHIIKYKIDVTIAGSTFWYPIENIQQDYFFHNISNDSNYIRAFDIKQAHKEGIEAYNKLDEATIIVTHVPSIVNSSHIKYNSTTCYLTPVKEMKTKHWVSGHVHGQEVIEKPYGIFYMNPLGYPDEKNELTIKTFEVKNDEI